MNTAENKYVHDGLQADLITTHPELTTFHRLSRIISVQKRSLRLMMHNKEAHKYLDENNNEQNLEKSYGTMQSGCYNSFDPRFHRKVTPRTEK